MEIPFLDLKRFDIGLKNQLKAKFEVMLDAGIFSGGGEVSELECKIQNKLNSRSAIACANGTDALELALRALEIGPGDEVIVPALTWVSTAEAVEMVGARPIFWDTDQAGLLASDWDQVITVKTKAVIPVHLYGKMVDMTLLTEKAKTNSIFVIEDAAQSFGAIQNTKAAGTWGDVGCISFYPTKNLGALGEAGMCLSQDIKLADRIRLLLNHGQPKRDVHLSIGRNSRIDTLQAGFLNIMLNWFDEFQNKRKMLAANYLEKLVCIEELELPSGMQESDHNAHLFVIQTSQRNELRDFLQTKGIGTAIHYPMILPEMKLFHSKGDFSNASKLSNQGLSLPLNPYLLESEQEFIIESIHAFFKK